jgi:benzylsuccinate CoA-transferase BbsE subunit
MDAGKNLVDADRESAQVRKLITEADVLLDGQNGRGPGAWEDQNPRLIHVVMTPFGWGLSPEWSPVDDLIVLGAGGLLHLGGYSDSGPVGAHGHQAHIASGIFGAVAALVGLIEREQTGAGSSADVSAQESIAQALEDSLAAYVLTGHIREPQGEEAREAGTGIYACQDGYVSMVAGRLGTKRAWSALVEWIDEEDLREEKWSEFSYRQTEEACDRFRTIFEDFAADKGKHQLYEQAQERSIALSPVNHVNDLFSDKQLQARSFFHRFRHEGTGALVTVPGPPFRFSRTPVPPLEAPFRSHIGFKIPGQGGGM